MASKTSTNPIITIITRYLPRTKASTLGRLGYSVTSTIPADTEETLISRVTEATNMAQDTLEASKVRGIITCKDDQEPNPTVEHTGWTLVGSKVAESLGDQFEGITITHESQPDLVEALEEYQQIIDASKDNLHGNVYEWLSIRKRVGEKVTEEENKQYESLTDKPLTHVNQVV